MRLPPSDATAASVRALVAAALAEADTTPRHRNWRHRALGMSIGEAVAEAPRVHRLCLKAPVGEMRMLRDVANERGVPIETLIRRIIGTWLVAVEEVDPAAIPYLLRGGMIGR